MEELGRNVNNIIFGYLDCLAWGRMRVVNKFFYGYVNRELIILHENYEGKERWVNEHDVDRVKKIIRLGNFKKMNIMVGKYESSFYDEILLKLEYENGIFDKVLFYVWYEYTRRIDGKNLEEEKFMLGDYDYQGFRICGLKEGLKIVSSILNVKDTCKVLSVVDGMLDIRKYRTKVMNLNNFINHHVPIGVKY